MHWETGTQTSVLAVDPVVSDKPTAAPLGGRLGALENTVSDGHSWTREPLWKTGVWQRGSNKPLEKKKFQHWRGRGRWFDITCITPSCKMAQLLSR